MDTTDELPAEVGSELVLGRYRLGPRLGAGGFGTVFAATDERLRRPVAVKVIPAARPRRLDPRAARGAGRRPPRPSRGSSPSSTPARTRARATSSPSWSTAARSTSSAPTACCRTATSLRIGLALCGALEHAHGRGVVHRDVKPQNVIIPDAPRSAAGVAKLADFGVAHLAGDEPLTRTGDVVGTLAYMAPEQAAGRRVDERADLYSLALVLYEALAGANPVRAGSPAATARRVGTVLPPLKRSRKDLPPDADRRHRPRAAPEAGGARDARRTRRRARGRAARGLRRRRHGRAPPARAHRAAPAPTGVRPRRRRGARRRPAGGALAWTGQPVAAALAAVLAVALLPRIGWLATAIAAIVVLALEQPGRGGRGRGGGASRPAAAVPPRHGVVGPALAPAARPRHARRRLSRAGRPRPRLVHPRRARRARRLVGTASTTCATKAKRASKAVATSGRTALRGRVGGRRAAPAVARPRTLARARRRRRAPYGPPRWARGPPRRPRRSAHRSRPDSCSLAFVAGLLAVAIPLLRRIASGGAVTPGRILCTRNHGHHFPVAARERPAQP